MSRPTLAINDFKTKLLDGNLCERALNTMNCLSNACRPEGWTLYTVIYLYSKSHDDQVTSLVVIALQPDRDAGWCDEGRVDREMTKWRICEIKSGPRFALSTQIRIILFSK